MGKILILNESQAKLVLEVEKNTKNWYILDIILTHFGYDDIQDYNEDDVLHYHLLQDFTEAKGFSSALAYVGNANKFFMDDEHELKLKTIYSAREKRDFTQKYIKKDIENYVDQHFDLISKVADELDLTYPTALKNISKMLNLMKSFKGGFAETTLFNIFSYVRNRGYTDISKNEFFLKTLGKSEEYILNFIGKLMGGSFTIIDVYNDYYYNIKNKPKGYANNILKQIADNQKIPFDFLKKVMFLIYNYYEL